MKKTLMMVLGLAIAVALWGTVTADEAKEPAGKTVFIASKCNSCHTISAAGVEKKAAEKAEGAAAEKTAAKPSKAPDLSSVGVDLKADWMAQYLKKEVATKAGKKHMKLWKGTDEDLAAVTAWLAEQKAEKKADGAKAEAAKAEGEVKAEGEAKAEAAPATEKPADDASKAAPETKAPEATK